MLRLNDGKLEICEVIRKSGVGGVLAYTLGPLRVMWYADLGTRTDEHYMAMQAGAKIKRRVRIRRDDGITPLHVIVIGGVYYKVGRVYPGYADKECKVAITDITLEEDDRRYETT